MRSLFGSETARNRRALAEGRRFEEHSFRQYGLLGAVTLLAATLRFYKLGEWSFWTDEMITVFSTQEAVEWGLAGRPLYLALIDASLQIFGTSEWAARLAPTLVGVITVPILFFPIRRILGTQVALISSLLLAVAPWHLYWSQNARFYSLLFLAYNLAFLLFFIGLEEDRGQYLLLSALGLGIAVHERETALMLLPVAALYVFLVRFLPLKRPAGFHPRNLILFFVPAGVIALVVSLPYVGQPSRWVETFQWVNTNPVWILAGVVYYVGVPTLILGTFGGLYLAINQDRLSFLLLIGALVPLVAIMAVSLVQFAANRYVFVTLLCWIILAGVAARDLLSKAKGSARLLASGALLVLIVAPLTEDALYYFFQNGNRDDWKAAFEFVGDHRRANDRVVAIDTKIGGFYLEESISGMASLDLADLEANPERVWIVEDMNVQDLYPGVLSWMQANTHEVANFDVHVQARKFKMRVHLYDPQNPKGQVLRR